MSMDVQLKAIGTFVVINSFLFFLEILVNGFLIGMFFDKLFVIA